ncbi:MAG TPA: T9SS type A sorting domain-containing protein [Melioribacteraceae bacterium]|nr:T9SS type A sorting domain-containing protein [Melioribacteraceae bacterium]
MKNIIYLIIFLISQISFAQINIGDVKQFYSVSYIDWDANDPQRIITATCKGISKNAYLFVDNSAYQPTQTQVNNLLEKFENVFVPIQTNFYGEIPNALDNDPRIYMLAVGNEWWGGYFDPAHQMKDSLVFAKWGKHSNEKEMIYFIADYFGNDYIYEVVSHEFGHLLHWGQDHSPEPINNPVIFWEDAWVDEQFSTFSPVITLEGINTTDLTDNSAFFYSNPNLPFIYFNTGANYNAVKLFITFMYEHYGDTTYIRKLISEQENGIKGINKTLAELGYNKLFSDVFTEWVIANYLDNKSFMDGKYGYKHYNFPGCRVEKTFNTFPTVITSSSLKAYAAKYYLFSTNKEEPIKISFNKNNSKFNIAFILYKNTVANTVDVIEHKNVTEAEFNFDNFGKEFNRVAMVVANVDSLLSESDNASYNISASKLVVSVENNNQTPNNFSMSEFYPNPFNPNSKCNFYLPYESDVNISLFNLLGEKLFNLDRRSYSAGYHTFEFNGIDLSSGVYFVKLDAVALDNFNKFSSIKKIILQK